jgi:hypothetical protein
MSTTKYGAHADDPPLSHRHAYYCNDLFSFKNRQKQLFSFNNTPIIVMICFHSKILKILDVVRKK